MALHTPMLDALKEFDSWAATSTLIQSPVFRAISLAPFVGYFILYGDAFQDVFKMTAIGGDLFLTTESRLRFIYYGGIAMLIASGFHWMFCPRIVKQFRNVDEYVDHFKTHQNHNTIVAALVETEAAFSRDRDGPGYEELCRSVSICVQASAIPERKLRQLADQGSFKDELEVLSGLQELADTWTQSMRNERFLLHSTMLLDHHFKSMNKIHNWLRRSVMFIGVLGVIAVSVPAVETFARVVLLDATKSATQDFSSPTANENQN